LRVSEISMLGIDGRLDRPGGTVGVTDPEDEWSVYETRSGVRSGASSSGMRVGSLGVVRK
jgi:hypothetical protein